MDNNQKQFIQCAATAIKALAPHFERIRDDVEAVFDSRSENWQESENGEKMQDEINALYDVTDLLDELCDAFEELF